MKITDIISHVLQYDMPEELGYSQQYYAKRTAHLVEVRTDEGVTGWGECFGPGARGCPRSRAQWNQARARGLGGADACGCQHCGLRDRLLQARRPDLGI